MEETKKRQKEVAVIFIKKASQEKVIYYKPVDLIIGYLDTDTNLFKNKEEEYHYMLNNEYKYGFGLRMTLKEFKERFKEEDISLKQTAHMYLKELKRYNYYFSAQDQYQFSNLQLIAQEKHTNTMQVLSEPDISIGQEILRELSSKAKQTNNYTTTKLNFDAKKLSDEIKKTVIGQDNAIDDIVTIIWQNLRSDTKSNILLIGPTGVGKTEIIRNISKKLDIPMASINITDTSQAAYLGTKLSDSLNKLVKNANNDIEKASRGIIFIDEIDKKAGFGEYNSAVMTTGVQDELLKLLEDNDYEVNVSTDPLIPQMVTINTKNITFICAGAFSNMEEVKKIETRRIGINPNRDLEEKSKKETSKKITNNDLVKYGLKAELVGRLHNIIELCPLNKENLIEIMKNPNNKTIQQKIELLNSLGIKLNLEEDVYDFLADKALKNNTGARGLVSAVDNLFIKAMKEISQSPDSYEELTINKETATDHHVYKLVKRKQ